MQNPVHLDNQSRLRLGEAPLAYLRPTGPRVLSIGVRLQAFPNLIAVLTLVPFNHRYGTVSVSSAEGPLTRYALNRSRLTLVPVQ